MWRFSAARTNFFVARVSSPSYYYRLVAANATGEMMPAFSATFTTRGRRRHRAH
jgi:hypothetical protein